MIHDEHCPECHGHPELVGAFLDRIVWVCSLCGHRWNEPRDVEQPRRVYIDRGWIRFEETRR